MQKEWRNAPLNNDDFVLKPGHLFCNSRYGVKHVLAGHTHTTTDVVGAGITIYTVGGTARTTDGRGCGFDTVAITAKSVAVAYVELTGPTIAPCCNYDLTAPIGGTCPRCVSDFLPPFFLRFSPSSLNLLNLLTNFLYSIDSIDSITQLFLQLPG